MMAAAHPPRPDMPVFETLRWLLEVMLTFDLQHPRLAQLGFRAAYGKSPLPEEALRRGRQATTDYFRALIERGQGSGELRREIDPSTAAWMLTERHTAEIQRMYQQVLAVLQSGLATPGH